jgi:hypothetical protein
VAAVQYRNLVIVAYCNSTYWVRNYAKSREKPGSPYSLKGSSYTIRHDRMVCNAIRCEGSFSLWKLRKWETNLYGSTSRIPSILSKKRSATSTTRSRQSSYGLKAALSFWQELLKAFKSMKYGRSKTYPCLYF